MRNCIEKPTLFDARTPREKVARIGELGSAESALDTLQLPHGLGDGQTDSLSIYDIDTVTGLPNRSGTLALLGAAIHQAKRAGDKVGVALVDIDDFQVISEAVGHISVGDLLRAVGRRLLQARANVVVGHLGGDRFLAFAAVTVEPGVCELAEELVHSLLTPFVVGDCTRTITASIGTCTAPRDGTVAPTLLVNAEAALSRAKLAGRDCVREFRSEMMNVIRRRALLEPDLRRAVERGDLTVFYQPQFSCDTDSMVGTEALLRWEWTASVF